MKSEKGITLFSLIIYVIVVSIVMTALAGLSNYIYGNMGGINSETYSSEEFNKFNLNFIKDVKKNTEAKVINSGNNVQIILKDNTNYNYISSEKALYRNKVKIAENINEFKAETDEKNNKSVIKVKIGTGKQSTQYGKTINYVLKYW